ncbi:succinate dehydrogenase, hydrophobic membrane anchor protein [Brachymonas chironomi]|uniref:succinate dehydrogenase, hydrophobic membrane anchor protein n=1 Tax=Brachymonas chironomi TaxID=491919 RepID=UPI000363B711|nr:succinate dehydrogenase, hydrophobic membrane anchor protein [Brachymonas chironomi]
MSSVNYGSKRRVIGASHYGVGDWLVQRATAIVMAVFTLALILAVIFTSGPLTYASWSGIFAATWMKFLTFATVISICWHAWIGVRNVFMDYIKPVGIRLALQLFAAVWLIGSAGWAAQVLWRL